MWLSATLEISAFIADEFEIKALPNAVAVATGYSHSIALRNDGTVATWGEIGDPANFVPTNLPPVKAIAAGWDHNEALLTNGAVVAWGSQGGPIPFAPLPVTNVPPDLTNVIAIAAGDFHGLAVRSDGTVEAWGDNTYGETNVPTGLSNVVAVAGGGSHSMALKADGTVVAWGNNTYGQTNVPAGLSNVMAIAAGESHSVALINDGTVVAWGDNSAGETNVPSLPLTVKLIAAGGNSTLAAAFSPLTQYPVDISKDLLLIYNTNSTDSLTVLNYYLAHRPGVASANVLGIGYTNSGTNYTNYYETIDTTDFTNLIAAPIQTWLTSNPTKRPEYVILFLDVPSRVNDYTVAPPNPYYPNQSNYPSVSMQIHTLTPGWQPFVTSINMNGTNDCIAYVNKLVSFSSNSPDKLFISASAGGYENTNYYFDDAQGLGSLGLDAMIGVTNAGISLLAIDYDSLTNTTHITQGTNVAGYFTWGANGGQGNNYYTNVLFQGASTWYIIETGESFNGRRLEPDQGMFVQWFSSIAFGGSNYSNTPIGAATHVDEPSYSGLESPGVYFGLWVTKRSFAICAWNSRNTGFFQAVGDPFIKN